MLCEVIEQMKKEIEVITIQISGYLLGLFDRLNCLLSLLMFVYFLHGKDATNMRHNVKFTKITRKFIT